MTEYLLSNHVHLRHTHEGAILLDLRRDEYLKLNQDQVTALRGLVMGWPRGENKAATAIPVLDDQVSRFLVEMAERGIVTTDAINGKPAAEAEIDAAETSLCEPSLPLPRHRLGYAATFLRACLRTSLALRLRSLEQVVAAVERRKRRRAPLASSSAADRLQDLMSVYFWLRPFIYTQKEKCLFDSLTLVTYLGSYGLFPNLVFGVRGRPFLAHAWVQHKRCALNYTAEYVKTFAPIMVI